MVLQSVLQSKLPGFAMHLPEQPPWQLAWQLGSVALHPPLQLASSWASHASCNFGGWQATSHEPLTSAVHVSLPLNTAPPQSEKMSARADPGAKRTLAPAKRARSEEERFTGETSKEEAFTMDGRSRDFLQPCPVEPCRPSRANRRPVRRPRERALEPGALPASLLSPKQAVCKRSRGDGEKQDDV